jgi:hypothetical protein
MPRRKRPKSKRKQDAIRHNAGIAAWRRAAAEYLQKGTFMHLPKKGTAEHAAMKVRQKQLLPEVQTEIDMLIIKENEEERQRKKLNKIKRVAATERFKLRQERKNKKEEEEKKAEDAATEFDKAEDDKAEERSEQEEDDERSEQEGDDERSEVENDDERGKMSEVTTEDEDMLGVSEDTDGEVAEPVDDWI